MKKVLSVQVDIFMDYSNEDLAKGMAAKLERGETQESVDKAVHKILLDGFNEVIKEEFHIPDEGMSAIVTEIPV